MEQFTKKNKKNHKKPKCAVESLSSYGKVGQKARGRRRTRERDEKGLCVDLSYHLGYL